jgi:hypothetical protein
MVVMVPPASRTKPWPVMSAVVPGLQEAMIRCIAEAGPSAVAGAEGAGAGC